MGRDAEGVEGAEVELPGFEASGMEEAVAPAAPDGVTLLPPVPVPTPPG
ncbi:hypothetical protein [Streptomyces sp. NPDC093990]